MPIPDLTYDFDIDHFLNRFIPRNRVHRLPKPISWFLGYRAEQPRPIGNVLVLVWAFVGAVAGLLVVEGVFMSPGLRGEGAPFIVASFGAAAILEFNTITSPLAQPRNAILGPTFSALTGIATTKLFLLLPPPRFEALRFLAGALSVGLASVVMGLTKTVHPPAGATALLCATNPAVTELGWFFAGLVALGSVLMVGVACVVNNLQRVWPVYWWTGEDLGKASGKGGDESGQNDDVRIDVDGIVVPNWLELEEGEKVVLESLKRKLGDRQGGGHGLKENWSRDSEMTRVGVGDDIEVGQRWRDENMICSFPREI